MVHVVSSYSPRIAHQITAKSLTQTCDFPSHSVSSPTHGHEKIESKIAISSNSLDFRTLTTELKRTNFLAIESEIRQNATHKQDTIKPLLEKRSLPQT
ncbi:MAG: hypothetical protein ACI814_002954 [Mariniblastus sp.]|jgi:hypothetical protein